MYEINFATGFYLAIAAACYATAALLVLLLKAVGLLDLSWTTATAPLWVPAAALLFIWIVGALWSAISSRR
ncbi:MAG: hypothetical protein AAGN64_10345 [Bacteroidota bacterium]